MITGQPITQRFRWPPETGKIKKTEIIETDYSGWDFYGVEIPTGKFNYEIVLPSDFYYKSDKLKEELDETYQQQIRKEKRSDEEAREKLEEQNRKKKKKWFSRC